MKKYLILSLIICLFFLPRMTTYGQTYKFPTSEESVILNGDYIASASSFPLTPITIRCKDWGFFFSPTFNDWRQHHKYKSCTDNVVFKVNEMDMHSTHSATVEYTYRLLYHLVGYTNPDDTVSTVYQVTNDDTLTISYNSSSSNQPYQNINLKKYSGFYKMVLTVNRIYKDDGLGGLIIADLTDPLYRNFAIEGQIVTQVYDKDLYGPGAALAPNIMATDHPAEHYLDVSWTLPVTPISPINYELEWTFVDNYGVSLPSGLPSPISSMALQYDFKKNSTRVWLDTDDYKIPLTYPKGFIVYRVRAVRPDSLLFKYPVYSDWSCVMPDNGSVSSASAGCSAYTGYGVYSIPNAYMHDSLNWQYTISFAEGGRFKHVGSFFDGLLKNRQSITRFNSDLSKLIVTDNIYDYEGRASIKTLPAPTTSPSFSYLHNVDLNSLTTRPYTAQDFDSGLLDCSNLLIPPLSSSALASHYYSQLNLDPDSLVHPWQKYVPDAQGYPFIQTVYEPGYADRVKAQGGAGPTLQVGDSNYLANSYVGAGQKKLNSLFGPNIGWSSFYNMTVSRDANKQLSMSIKDYEGHMVASALIGQGPDSSDHAIITDNLPVSQRFDQDLLLPATPNQAIDTLTGTRTADADYFNEAQGDDSLLYEYNLLPYPVCTSQNLAVKAHLRSYITDKCGNLLFDHVADFGDNGMVAATPINYSVVAGSFSADVAPYHVQKKLSYYPSDISDAVDSFLKYGNCFRTPEDFIRSSVTSTPFPCTGTDNIDSTPCDKMKWDMMRQLFPGAVYGQYYYDGTKLKGTDNSIFSAINCHYDSVHVLMYHQHIDTVGYCIQPYDCFTMHEWGMGSDGIMRSDAVITDGTSTFAGTKVCGTLSSSLTPSAVLSPSITITLIYALSNPIELKQNFGTCVSSSITGGDLTVTHSSVNIRAESGDIRSLASPHPVIGSISYAAAGSDGSGKSTITIFSVPITGTDMSFTWSGTLPSGQVINIVTSPSTTVGFTYTTDTTYIPYIYSYSTGFIDSSTCKYRYQDTCLVSSLKDTITVGGVFYNHIRTMSADSFRMIYSAAITEGNYTIAEALLPLHPQYCELQNCFVDSFKKQVAAIPNWRVAQSLGLLTLDDIVANDPLKPIMTASGLFPHPSDTLSTFGGGHMRLDTFILINAYCSAADSTMFNQCTSSMFSIEIRNHLLINDEVKDYYFKNVSNTYFALRQNVINKLFFHGGTSCAHCAGARMDLDTAAAVPPVPFSNDYTHASDSSFMGPHSGWFAHIATLDTGDMHDSAIVFSYYMDTMMAHRSMDTIMAHLSNCIIGSTTIRNAIKTKLQDIYNSGAAPRGDFTSDQILTAIRAGGATMNDLCNPYVISAAQFSSIPLSTIHDCKSAAYYRSVDTFLNDSHILAMLHAPGVSTMTLDPTHHYFHSLVASALGNNTACTLRSSFTPIRSLYEVDITTAAASGAGDTVKIFLHCPGNAYFFSATGTYNITSSCINNNSALSSAAGLVNEYSFVANVSRTGTSPGSCTMQGWVDSISTMDYSDNTLADCIPCTEMKSLYKQFADTMVHYGINGADHPLYGTMLANFMNSKLIKQFAADDYERFIQSCALADSMLMPVYNEGYASCTFTSNLAMNGFITSLNSINPAYDFSNSFRDSVSGALRVVVDLNNVPVQDLWKYKIFLNAYGPSTVNQPFVLFAPSSGTEAGFIYSDTAIAFSPADSNIIDTAYVKYRLLATRGVWQGDHFVPKKVYNIVAVAGAPAYAISRSMSKLTAYFSVHYTAGAVFTACYQHTVDDDYYKPQKQALLAYTYSLQQLPAYQVLDSLKPGNLMVRIPSYSGYSAGYAANMLDGATYTNLYISNAGMNNRLFDTLQRIITLASSSAGYGYIFPSALATAAYSSGVMDLEVYRNADHTYWYRYFTTGDSLLNVYISLPEYIPMAVRSMYHVVSIAPAPGDSLNRCFTVGIRKGADPTVLYASGRADFVISKSVQLEKVLLGNFADSIANPADTFNNCERGNLLGAVSAGVFNYNAYTDSIKRAVKGNLTAYLARNTKEKLILSYMDHEFNLTLYSYDRAGNLVYTVPPAGSQPILPVGTLLNDVDTARINNTPALSPAPVYNKINTYNYNSYDLVQQQNTIDGGKTRFFYDNAGRLIFSQNAKQAPAGYYTYNIYDQQNRLTETGESQLGCAYFDPHIIPIMGGGSSVPYCHYTYTTTVPTSGGMSMLAYLASPDPYLIYNINSVSYDTIVKFIRTRNRRDVVMTFYDTVAKKLEAIPGLDAQDNLRKRVTCVKYFESLTSIDKTYYNYSYATHYSYDIEGNVNMLVQDFPDLSAVKQQYKRVDYDYDVISGKVNMLSYNRGWPDQFYQRYSYDADNRLTQVNTSSDGMLWNKDASYYYYQHGPLARVELGDLTVQGVDYAYTIQGWLKSVNSDSLNVGLDMAQDGTDTSVFARDAVAYAIDYFKNDYKPISYNSLQHTTPVTHSLYNGNISRQTMAINEFQRLNKQYAYDQLNRIRNAGYSSVNAADYSLSSIFDYKNDYTYDADGNLQSLNRYGNNTGSGAQLMDSLVYKYTPGGLDNKLQSVLDYSTDHTDNALTTFTDNTVQRYMYDPIGNTVKDMVSGQDTIRWNLYNKVKSTQNNTGGNTMQFRYDGAGNRVAKYFSTGSDTGTNQTNNYYVHDAQGNILATYNEKTRFTMEPLTFIHLAHRGLRSTVGGDENFNNLFITPEFAGVAEFQDMLLKRSLDNGDFTNVQTDHSVSYYLNSTGRIKDFIFSDPSYLPDLVAADVKAEQPILAPAFISYFKNGGDEDVLTLLSLALSTPELQQHTLGLLCAAHNGDSTLWFIHKRYSDAMRYAAAQQSLSEIVVTEGNSINIKDTTTNTDTTRGGGITPSDTTGNFSDSSHFDSSVVLNCDTLIQHILDDKIEQSMLAKATMVYAVTMGAMDDWLKLISTDNMLYADDGSSSSSVGEIGFKVSDRSDGLKVEPGKGGVGKALVSLAMNSLVNYEDGYGNLLSFLDSWEGSPRTMEALFNTTDKLRAVFNNDPAAYVNAFNTAFGDDEIDSAVAALPRLSLLTHITTAAADLGIGLPPTLATVAVVKEKQFDLATHDIYGSSRLGVKSYYPHQVGISYTQDGGFTDTNRLWTRRPWYSLEYQDIINQDSLNLYGNGHKDMYYTQHTRGLKQYELTDHLGDVLVTLSDKRAMNRWLAMPGAVDSILSYKPVVVTAYDYYPFGQYMPGRYTEDTTSYCYTTTLTEMVTVVTMVNLDLGHPRMMNSGGSNPIVRPSDNGGILILMDGAGAGTGTGVSWPMGDGGDDPGGGTGTGNPQDGDVLVTATVRDGVFNVSVIDDSTGKNLGNVVMNGGNNNGTIKIHYTGTGHSTSVHVTLDNAGNSNVINISAIKVPHYTSVPQNIVSRVCNGESYRYGFNGKMKDNEWAGLGNHIDYGARGYDPRIARFNSVDPLGKQFPWYSSYQFAGNTPIQAIDLDGKEEYHYTRIKDNSGKTTSIQLNSVKDIYVLNLKATFSASLGAGAWTPVYDKNPYQSHVVHQTDTKYMDNVYGLAQETNYDESVSYPTQAAAARGTDADFQNTAADIGFWFQQGLNNVAQEVRDNGGPIVNSSSSQPEITVPYKRPNNATTPAQRASVQGKPCVDCGITTKPMVADHIYPLVKEHYETGGIDLERMRSVEAVQPQCPTCSSKQGAELRKYGQEQKAKIPPPNGQK